jgi:diguanylate cyclase (GGDEF)-like protein
VELVCAYLGAFRRGYTFDPRRNPYLWFGLAWGGPVPVFSFAFDLALGAAGRTPLDAIAEHPVHLIFLAHPLLFALIFGAMGTLRHELERENQRLIGELRSLATTDPLTGIANRRRVMEELEATLARASRSRQPFAVVLLDLDGFKRINDEQGHPAGDVVLRKTAAALQGVTRQGDLLGRYGGDEFMLVIHGELTPEDPLIHRAAEAVGRDTGLGLSAGVARYPEDGSTGDGLMAAADARLYEVKRTRARTRSS